MRKIFPLFLAITLAAAAVVQAGADSGGTLFLTDEKISFSLVGEQADIYAGTVPADQVQWESSDPSVICVGDDGALTAVGVGSAVITARWQDSELTCQAECLAENRDALLRLPLEQLQSPKRIPAEVTFDPTEFFSDATIVGDSMTAGMMVYEMKTNLMGHPLFLCRKNVGVFNFANYIINLNYQGKEYSVEDAVAVSGVKKVFFLLGVNDLGYQTVEEAVERYALIIDRVREKSPEVEIYLQTCTPRYAFPGVFTEFNEKFDQFNAQMTEMALQKDCYVVDVAAYIKDHINGMAKGYSLDWDAHMNEEGSIIWMNVLRAYAYSRLLEGSV